MSFAIYENGFFRGGAGNYPRGYAPALSTHGMDAHAAWNDQAVLLLAL
jgi:hypothetical protein